MPLLKTPLKHLSHSELHVKQEHWSKKTSITIGTDEENYFPWK